MRIAITGASGFVGSRTAAAFRDQGHEVVPLVRSREAPNGTASWDAATGEIDHESLGAIDAFVHLAGESVVGGRWSVKRKLAIADSRGPVTERLCHAVARLEPKPAVLVSASAVGFYGNRGDEELAEDSTAGDGFLSDVSRAWEAATMPASDSGIRVVNLRIGMVLDKSGGALQKMLLPFKLGLGGRLGSGRQWTSWIALDDLVAAILFVTGQPTLSGVVNAVSPGPVTNREFTQALGRALRRPAFLPAPAFVLRLIMGEMADALLLSGQRVLPRRLLEAGFEFRHTEIEAALAALTSRSTISGN